ncbi:hypothetical protein Barb6_03825 [Bacteroidales bacterium Barb6]|nr:hypothetical protein Barb6_03825 [Bacteroidales bacterium Barb6]
MILILITVVVTEQLKLLDHKLRITCERRGGYIDSVIPLSFHSVRIYRYGHLYQLAACVALLELLARHVIPVKDASSTRFPRAVSLLRKIV